MMQILIILGVVAGGLAGYKYGHYKGLKDSWIVQDKEAMQQVIKMFDQAERDEPNTKFVVELTREGFDIMAIDDYEEE